MSLSSMATCAQPAARRYVLSTAPHLIVDIAQRVAKAASDQTRDGLRVPRFRRRMHPCGVHYPQHSWATRKATLVAVKNRNRLCTIRWTMRARFIAALRVCRPVLYWLPVAIACSKSNTPPGSSAADSGVGASGSSGGAASTASTTDSSAAGDRFEPTWLPNTPANTIPGELSLFASTLLRGQNGFELYAAVRNEGPTPLCGAGILLEFYDHADQLIGTASGSVSGKLYQFVDGSVTIYCVDSGESAMAWSTALPAELALDQLAYITHRFPAFAVDVKPLPSLTVTQVGAFMTDTGVAFKGNAVNHGDVPLSQPHVAVFPLNGVGRPLGMVTSTAMVEIPPQGTWSFETSALTSNGTATFAFATGVRRANP